MTLPGDQAQTVPLAPAGATQQLSKQQATAITPQAITTATDGAQVPPQESQVKYAPYKPQAAAENGRGASSMQAQAKRHTAPLRIVLTILQLAAVGCIGLPLFGVLLGVLGTGVGLTFLFGLGLVVLVGLVYGLFGLGWFEIQRVSGLYDLNVSALRLQQQRGTGFKAWFGAITRQSIDGRMWRSITSLLITSILGTFVLLLAQLIFRGFTSIVTLESTNTWWQPGILSMLVGAAGIVGLALLHRIVTIALIGSDAVEEQLEAQVRVTSQQREGAVRAADVERTRIERDLHDGVQPRLVSVGMTLGLAQQKIDTDPAAAKELVAEAHTSTKAAITELRQLARGIYASVLDDRGLDAALSSLAARSHIPVQLDVRVPERCSRNAEAAIYFAIAESITNAAKHSRASETRVVVRVRDEGVLWARVEDNGIGNARVVPGGGLDGIMNRVLAAGGTVRLDSPHGGPTSLEVSVPCES